MLRPVDVNSPDDVATARASRPPAEDESLLARLESFLGARYSAFVVVLALALALLLALAASVQEGSGPQAGSRLWMLGLDPVILVYILAVHPLMRPRWERAMHSLEALAPHAASARPERRSRGGEWAALLAGALAGLAVARRLPGMEGWLRLYAEATSALMFALLASVIYGSVMRSRHLAARLRTPGLQLNVFDGHLLTPFAQWGQSLSLVFVGGISLSLLFQSYESLRSIEGVIIYGCLIVVAMTLFFMSMWTIHVALAKAQHSELARVRRDLAAARAALTRRRTGDVAEAVQDAYVPAAVLGLYERQVLDAPTWPFNPAIVGRVFASAVAPLGVYVLKLAFGVGAGP